MPQLPDFAGIQTEIMSVALDNYLGTEDQWCTGALARDKKGNPLDRGTDKRAVSHCAEGAIAAATWDVMVSRGVNNKGGVWHFSLNCFSTPVFQGVEKVLVEQHPEFVATLHKLNGEKFDHGGTLSLFNDGVMYATTTVGFDSDGELIKSEVEYGVSQETATVIPGVGYLGIRAAFEKYLAQCEEKGL